MTVILLWWLAFSVPVSLLVARVLHAGGAWRPEDEAWWDNELARLRKGLGR